MKHSIKKLALLFVTVYLWFAFFVAFEPNNYFGIKKTASSSQPVARVRAYEPVSYTHLESLSYCQLAIYYNHPAVITGRG